MEFGSKVFIIIFFKSIHEEMPHDDLTVSLSSSSSLEGVFGDGHRSLPSHAYIVSINKHASMSHAHVVYNLAMPGSKKYMDSAPD